jgi:hypothetical protein
LRRRRKIKGRIGRQNTVVAVASTIDYVAGMIRLTKQEQLVLCFVLGLLLTGWAVKVYRTAHPPATAARPATP